MRIPQTCYSLQSFLWYFGLAGPRLFGFFWSFAMPVPDILLLRRAGQSNFKPAKVAVSRQACFEEWVDILAVMLGADEKGYTFVDLVVDADLTDQAADGTEVAVQTVQPALSGGVYADSLRYPSPAVHQCNLVHRARRQPACYRNIVHLSWAPEGHSPEKS